MANEFYQKMQEAKLRKLEAKAKQEEAKSEKANIKNETQRIKNQKAIKQNNKKSGNIIKKVSKVIGYSKQLSSNLTKGFMEGSNQSHPHAGRPHGSLKHISPLTGKPVFAQQYYKEMRFVRRQNQILADRSNQQRNIQLARQGITPQQFQQINMQRQMMQQQMPQRQISQPIQQSNQVQNQVQNRPSIWNRSQGVAVQDAGLFGPRTIIIGRPESFWN